MNLKALIAAPLAAWLMIASASTIVKPIGWSYSSNGKEPESYQMGVDTSVTWEGKSALTVVASGQRSTAYGDIHNYTSHAGYGGRRIRFSGMLKTSGVDGWAGPYLLAGKLQNTAVMSGLPAGSGAKGSTGQWVPVSVVIDVPMEAVSIQMGLKLVGNGQAWLSDLKFEEVGSDVALTTSKVEMDLEKLQREVEESILRMQKMGPRSPRNLELKTQ
jgi:hypothetical protein